MHIRILQDSSRIFPFSASVQNLKNTFPGVSFPDKPSTLLLKEYDIYPVQDIKPEYNENKQKLVQRPPEDFTFSNEEYFTVYDIVALTDTEFNSKQAEDEAIDTLMVKKLLKIQFDNLTIPDEEINEYASLYPPFKVGEAVIPGDRRQYQKVVWEVKTGQGHTTQLDWLPPDVPALWKRVYEPGTIQLWVEPTMAEDSYTFGDKVYWPDENTTWISTVPGINTNTWEPGVYGWDVFTG
jgi:hypothetical protein